MNYRLFLELDGKKTTNFYGLIFWVPVEDKSVLRLKNQSRTGKTDAFSSPGALHKTYSDRLLYWAVYCTKLNLTDYYTWQRTVQIFTLADFYILSNSEV